MFCLVEEATVKEGEIHVTVTFVNKTLTEAGDWTTVLVISSRPFLAR